MATDEEKRTVQVTITKINDPTPVGSNGLKYVLIGDTATETARKFSFAKFPSDKFTPQQLADFTLGKGEKRVKVGDRVLIEERKHGDYWNVWSIEVESRDDATQQGHETRQPPVYPANKPNQQQIVQQPQEDVSDMTKIARDNQFERFKSCVLDAEKYHNWIQQSSVSQDFKYTIQPQVIFQELMRVRQRHEFYETTGKNLK